MKMNGILIEARFETEIKFYREPKPITFTLRSFKDEDGLLEKLLPLPEPRYLTLPGGEKKLDNESGTYTEALRKHFESKMNYQCLKSITGIEWDTVVDEEPSTWGNWRDDMLNAGFTDAEVTKMETKVLEVNGITEPAVEDAEKNS